MNFPLKQLENHLLESWLLAGEELYEAGALHSLTEVERHLWIARVGDCEVEVQISPSRVREMTCDCQVFKREKGCGHVAATLLALRNRLTEKQQARPAKNPKPSKTPRITIPGLLDHVDPEELAEFVRDYARQNRSFALALKARFTGALPLDDKREKFLELLETTINSVRSKSDQVSYRGSQQLAQIVRELLSQAEEAIAGHSLKEASILLTSILEKIGPASRKIKAKDNKLDEILLEVFRQLEQVLQLKPAPDLLQDLWDFSIRENGKYLYRRSTLQALYFRLMVRIGPELGKTSELVEAFREQLRKMDIDDPNRRELLVHIYQLLGLQGDAASMESHLIDHFHEPGLVLHVVEEAMAAGHWKKARFLAEKGLENARDPAHSKQLEEHLLQLALRENDREAVLHFAAARFLESRNPRYLEALRTFSGKDWHTVVDELLQGLENQPWSIAKRDAIAGLLHDDERFDQLHQYILRLQSLDLLQRYGPSWPDGLADQAEELYQQLLQNYLINHLGRKPSQRVRELLEQLLNAGKDGLTDRLLTRFRTEFAGRQSLMEELEALQHES